MSYLTEKTLPLGRKAVLACFGKHPGWDDHLDDLGIDTTSLAWFKQWCYVDGIGQMLGRDRWPAARSGRLPWNHRFISQCGSQWIIGNLTASCDGQGRELYPLVVAVQAQVSEPNLLELLLRQVNEASQAIAQIADAKSVKRFYAESSLEIASSVECQVGSWQTSSESRQTWLENHGKELELIRLFHALEQAEATVSLDRSWVAHLPWVIRPEGAEIAGWIDFLRTLLGKEIPLTIYWKDGQSQATLVLGSMGAEAWGSFFPTTKTPPLVTQVPYIIPDEEVNAFAAKVKAWQQDGAYFIPQVSLKPSFWRKMSRWFGGERQF
jgi:type VI secretion system ImpM family protein